LKTDEVTHGTIFEILTLFIRINKKFNRIESQSIEVTDEVKLYPSELHIIEAIGYNYADNVTSLSIRFGITKGAVSQVVNKLFVKGFVSKERNRIYGKEIILSLTDEGWLAFSVLDSFHERMGKEFINFLECYTSEQVDSFLEIMGSVEDYVDTFLKDELV
jgi:DNA-binding MarR family transcriptional regulator